MSGYYIGWLLLLAVLAFLWALLFIRAVKRLGEETEEAEEAGIPEPKAGLLALEGFFSDPSIITERRQLLWLTALFLLVLVGGPYLAPEGRP